MASTIDLKCEDVENSLTGGSPEVFDFCSKQEGRALDDTTLAIYPIGQSVAATIGCALIPPFLAYMFFAWAIFPARRSLIGKSELNPAPDSIDPISNT